VRLTLRPGVVDCLSRKPARLCAVGRQRGARVLCVIVLLVCVVGVLTVCCAVLAVAVGGVSRVVLCSVRGSQGLAADCCAQ
jgi:hypothetical protein